MNMDFIMGLSYTRRQHNFIWVVVHRMNKSIHFLSIKTSYSVEDYARMYFIELVKLHILSLSIILDCGS